MRSIIIINMEFVDRKEEQRRLEALLNADKPAFVVIRGRRRIGKSALIAKVLNQDDIYYEADRSATSNQIASFAAVVAHHFPDFPEAIYSNWRTILVAINRWLGSKITVCLDEFPYLAESDPSLPSVIQGLLDDGKLQYNLILCGSSQRMMYELTHDEQAPLYGRDDADFKMNPIRLPYLQEALHLSPIETIENYAVWGGVPRYWLLRESSGGLRDAIDKHILSNLGALYEEPLRLFRDDIKDIVKTSTIMSIVGGGSHRLREIASRCNEPATNLSRPLAKLVDLGYLEKETPFGESVRDSKKNLYRIADPFLSFHFKFVSANRSFIELGRRAPINIMLERDLPGHFGYWWEHLCRDAVSGNYIDGVLFGEARRWWSKDVELDVVAESIDHKTILIGECKWTEGENGRLMTRTLERIAANLPFTAGKNVMFKLFTKVLPDEDQGNAILPEAVINAHKDESLKEYIQR